MQHGGFADLQITTMAFVNILKKRKLHSQLKTQPQPVSEATQAFLDSTQMWGVYESREQKQLIWKNLGQNYLYVAHS